MCVLVLASAAFDAYALDASKFIFPCNPVFVENRASVQEFHEAATDRYHLSWTAPASLGPFIGSACNVSPFATLPAPDGTRATGLGWNTLALPCVGPSAAACGLARGVCVYRVDGQPEPASLFVSINPLDCEAASKLGWRPVPAPPMTVFEVEPATGRCPAPLVAVRRFVNTGSGKPLNHRYVIHGAVQREMRSRPGWVEEGTAFCVPESIPGLWGDPIEGPESWLQLAPCVPGQAFDRGCLEAVNLQPSFSSFQRAISAFLSADFAGRTGAQDVDGLGTFVIGYPSDDPAALMSRSFVQTLSLLKAPGTVGIQLVGSDRAAGHLSSIVVRYPGRNLRPFAGNQAEDLALTYTLMVKRVRAEGAADAAYVQPLVRFVDGRSGVRLVLSPGAIGTPEFADGAGRDAASGDVLVFVTLGPGTSVGTSLGLPSLRTPRAFDADGPWGWGGDYSYRLNRSSFREVLARARLIDPRLSAEPGDYVVESVGLKGEAAGDAEIGFNLVDIALSLAAP